MPLGVRKTAAVDTHVWDGDTCVKCGYDAADAEAGIKETCEAQQAAINARMERIAASLPAAVAIGDVFSIDNYAIDDEGRTMWPAIALYGPREQTAGGVWVISSMEQVKLLLDRLMNTSIAGIDSEFDGVNLKKESPRGRGKIACWSVAFPDEALGRHPRHDWLVLAQRVYIPNHGKAEEEGWLYAMRHWLGSADHGKVGSYWMNTDQHLFANHGIKVDGVVMDQVRMSQAWRMGRVYEHGLKPTMEEMLGYQSRDYADLFSVAIPSKRTGEPTKKFRVLSLRDEVVTDSARLPTLIDYASLDPKASLESALVLRREMENMPWREGFSMRTYNETVWNPYQYLVYGIEDAGWPVDTEWLGGQHQKAERDINECDAKLNRWAGTEIDWGSWQQKQQVLFGSEPLVMSTKANPKKKRTKKGEIWYEGGAVVLGKGLPVSPVTKGGPTEEEKKPTDATALRWVMDHCRRKEDKAAIKTLLLRTKYDTIDKFFLKNAAERTREDGKMYSRIGTETETGRLTSKSPPLNVLSRSGWNEETPWEGDPYDVREGFICEPGTMLVSIDFSQLEMRILAHYLIALFQDRSLADDLATGDLHANTALRVWSHDPLLQGLSAKDVKSHPDPRVRLIRNRGKTLNFKVNYGGTAYSLGAELRDAEGEPIGKEAAQAVIDQYFRGYAGILRFQRWAKAGAHKNGYVRDLLGCYRFLPGIHSWNKRDVSAAERAAVNTHIQMSAARIIMLVMLRLNALRSKYLEKLGHFHPDVYNTGAKLIMQVHDELIWQVPIKNAERLIEIAKPEMERPFDRNIVGFPSTGLPLPCDAGKGTSYAALK